MNANDQEKLCKNGYVILRRMDTPLPHIKYKSKSNPRSWKKYDGNYQTKDYRIKKLTCHDIAKVDTPRHKELTICFFRADYVSL